MNNWSFLGIWIFMLGFLIGKASPKVGDIICIIGALVTLVFGMMDVIVMVQRP